MQKRPVAIDLFAGAGGFSLGLQLAGYEVPLSLEIDEWACDTLRHNHPDTKVVQGDIRDFSTPEAIKKICPHAPDLIVGGPPCQGFSVAGPAKKDPKDPRNSLFVNFSQWIACLEPKSFIIENVKGLLSRRNADGERVIDIIKNTFTDLGYSVDVWVLNAAEYGVPQARERVFIVGHRRANSLLQPSPTHLIHRYPSSLLLPLQGEALLKPALTLWEAISDLPMLGAGEGEEENSHINQPENPYQEWIRGGSAALFNHVAMSHSKRLVERFKHIAWGESSSDVPAEHAARRRSGNGGISESTYDQNNRRLHPHKPSHTIAAAFYANFIHPFQHRNLTAREGARVQSFPDRYRFLGKKTVVSQKLLHREERFDEKHLCQYNQIGNAVPPLLARAVTEHVREQLVLC